MLPAPVPFLPATSSFYLFIEPQSIKVSVKPWQRQYRNTEKEGTECQQACFPKMHKVKGGKRA